MGSYGEDAHMLGDNESEQKSDSSDDEKDDVACFDIAEDIYGMCVVSLVLDTQAIHKSTGSKAPVLRYTRILLTVLLLLGCIALQVFLLVCVKKFVSSWAVKEIRSSYGIFESKMYDGDTLNADHFDSLGADEKLEVCQIPFSQPIFFISILGVWTISILSEVKEVVHMGRCTVGLETSPGFAKMTELAEEGNVIMRLPRQLKAFIFFVVLIPRVLIAGVLLWLGCRWLAGTPNFSDLLLNSVALQFIADLRELMYDRLTPARGKRDLGNTKFLADEDENPTPCNLLGAYGWIVFVFVFVIVYIYGLQQVLPTYKWDVHDVCADFIAQQGDFNR